MAGEEVTGAAVVATALAATDVDPALLKRLADHDERMEKFLDAHELKIDAVVRDLDGDGKLKKTTTSQLTQRRVDGKLKTTVVRSDDPDEKKHAAERDEKNERTESPFAARNQSKYRFKQLSDVMISFEPKGEKHDRILEGVAFIDAEAGELTKLVMQPAKLPMFADAMKMQIDYENHTDAGRNISKFVLEGSGGFLFIKRRGDLTMRFSF